ncbi:ribbon-helix-helix domain-containing protein [bacterium]|nr:ribbon-helix-helix domain-containing protein [bacterium]
MKKKQTIKKSEFISVRISEDSKKALQKIAAREDRSISWIVAKIIEDHLKKK